MVRQARIREFLPTPLHLLEVNTDNPVPATASFSSTSRRSITATTASSSEQSRETGEAKHPGFAHAAL